MSNYFGKTLASRILKAQNLAWSGSGTSVTTNFSAQTYEVRVISQINGYIAIEPAATQGTVMSTGSGFQGGTFIAANTASGDFFACVPGMVLTFTSSTTTTGSSIISVSELG
jgi:hypothetical protein